MDTLETPVFTAEPTVEQGLKTLLKTTRERAFDQYDHCEEYVRQKPGKAVLVALAAGYLLHRLPVRSILVTKVKILAALTPPALLAYGAAKTAEYLQRQAAKKTL